MFGVRCSLLQLIALPRLDALNALSTSEAEDRFLGLFFEEDVDLAGLAGAGLVVLLDGLVAGAGGGDLVVLVGGDLDVPGGGGLAVDEDLGGLGRDGDVEGGGARRGDRGRRSEGEWR